MSGNSYDRMTGMMSNEQFEEAVDVAVQNADPGRGLSKGAGYHVGRVAGAAIGVGAAGTVGVASLGVKGAKAATKVENRAMFDVSQEVAALGSTYMAMCGVSPRRIDPRLAGLSSQYVDKDQKNGYQMGG